MIWANKNEQKIKATPGQRAICPLCCGEVIARCGEIKIWHWSHKANYLCDTWGEHETEWHIKWKNYFQKKYQEVIIKNHQADIKNKDGLVIELQNSSLSSFKIKEREKFYGKMIWLLNGETLAKNMELREKSYGLSFRWKWFPFSWKFANKVIYIDFSSLYKDVEIFVIKKLYIGKYIAGWGRTITKKDFIRMFGGKNGRSNNQ